MNKTIRNMLYGTVLAASIFASSGCDKEEAGYQGKVDGNAVDYRESRRQHRMTVTAPDGAVFTFYDRIDKLSRLDDVSVPQSLEIVAIDLPGEREQLFRASNPDSRDVLNSANEMYNSIRQKINDRTLGYEGRSDSEKKLRELLSESNGSNKVINCMDLDKKVL